MNLASDHVLVAGGAGFIGSHLCEALRAAGRTVTCVDDLSTGSRANIAHLAQDPGFLYVAADVTAPLPAVIAERCATHGLRAVAHLASAASPPAYLARPLETLAVGSTGTAALCALAAAHGARLLLASTSEVYGDPLEHPQRETYWGNVNPIGERSVYDEAKRFAEALTMAWHRARGLDVGIVRIFNTYGPRLAPGDGRVVSTFIAQALAGRPYTVFGDGTQTRSFCYVSDMVAGLMAMLEATVTGPVNLGNPDEFTLLELAAVVSDLVGVDPGLTHHPLPSDDPRVRRPDITLARTALGWAPRVDLRTGLAATIAWQRSL